MKAYSTKREGEIKKRLHVFYYLKPHPLIRKQSKTNHHLQNFIQTDSQVVMMKIRHEGKYETADALQIFRNNLYNASAVRL